LGGARPSLQPERLDYCWLARGDRQAILARIAARFAVGGVRRIVASRRFRKRLSTREHERRSTGPLDVIGRTGLRAIGVNRRRD
jgi:hypothetical protein